MTLNQFNKLLGEKLKARRLELGMSQLAVARKIRMKQQAVSCWEHGKGCSFGTMLKLMPVLKVTLSFYTQAHSTSKFISLMV